MRDMPRSWVLLRRPVALERKYAHAAFRNDPKNILEVHVLLFYIVKNKNTGKLSIID